MSLLSPHLRPCLDCGAEIDTGKKQTRRLCDDCRYARKLANTSNWYVRARYQIRKTRRCKRCNGVLDHVKHKGSQYCGEYCKWVYYMGVTKKYRNMKRSIEAV